MQTKEGSEVLVPGALVVVDDSNHWTRVGVVVLPPPNFYRMYIQDVVPVLFSFTKDDLAQVLGVHRNRLTVVCTN